jgi:MFS family permease
MGGRARNWWPFAAIAAIVVVTVAGLYLLWRSPQRTDWEGFGALAIPAAGVAAGWIAWVWRARSRQASGVVPGPELGRLADLLAGAVDEQWTRAAGERGLLEPEPIPVRWQRPVAPFAGPVAAAVASTRFAPLPGLAAIGERRLQSGQVDELHEVYGGLGSGRLVIAGAPGSGKSGAAVLLILAALHYRQRLPDSDRPRVPVPVMFTPQGWDPSTERVQDWLAGRLCGTYPLFAGRQGVAAARGMLAEGRIAVLLDGLDEIPEDLRPAVLTALSQQATFRLVLLTRSAEMAAAAAQALLQGAAAIELQDIDPGTAADYLTRTQLDPPPRSWHEVTSRLRQEPDSPLTHALSNPLMLTLVRDTYRAGDDAGELLGLRDAAGHPASGQDIAGYLLDRVLPAAYTHQPGEPPPRYDLPAAERALRRIATRMNNDGLRDLQWWHVPAWAPAAPRIIATGLLLAPLAALAAGLAISFVPLRGLGGLVAWLVLGLMLALVLGFVFGRGNKLPNRIAPVRMRHLFRRRPLMVGLLAALTAGIFAWSAAQQEVVNGHFGPATTPYRLAVAVIAGVVAWLAAGLAAGLVAGMSQPGTDTTSPLNPRASWRSDRAFGLVVGLVIGPVAGLVLGFAIGLATALVFGLKGVLMFVLLYMLVIGLLTVLEVGLAYPQWWPSSLAFAQLAASDRTPVRLMRFLEDARSRNVLRTVGPVYQFRHGRLQDRLAGQESATRQRRSEPSPTAGNATA